MNLPLDVDGDGRLDVVAVLLAREADATGTATRRRRHGLWPETVIEKNGNFECGDLVDIDGDGKATEILPHTPRTVWYEVGKLADGKPGLIVHVVSEKPMDVRRRRGRRQRRRPARHPPARRLVRGPGRHPQGPVEGASLAAGRQEEGKADHTPQILVYDVNGDGLNDIITSPAPTATASSGTSRSATATRSPGSSTRSTTRGRQAHSLTLADLDGDGDLDLVTGKRFWPTTAATRRERAAGRLLVRAEAGPHGPVDRHAISDGEGIGSA